MRKETREEWVSRKAEERRQDADRFASRIRYLANEGIVPHAVGERIVRHPAIAVKTLVAVLENSSRQEELAFLNLIDLIGILGGPVARRSLLRLLGKVRGRWADNVALNALNHVGTRTPREVERLFEVLHDERFTSYGRATAWEGLLDRVSEKRRRSYLKRLIRSLQSPDVRDNPEIWEVVVKWRTDLPRLPEYRPLLEDLLGPFPWNEDTP